MCSLPRACAALVALALLSTAPLIAAEPGKPARSPAVAPAAGQGYDRAGLLAAARKIDEFIARGYEQHKLKPQPLVSDVVFMRRAYLDIVGRNPTLEEIGAFMRSKDRRKLVDQLIESEGYVHHSYAYWADLLRLHNRLTGAVSGEAYNQFVKGFVRGNKPYDKFVYELVAAEGRYIENPATGYLLRDEGMPLDNLAQTVRIFLGTSISCAQCHDHPFDKWTQLEFYEMSAYTYGVEYRHNGVIPAGQAAEWNRKIKSMNLPANIEVSASLLIGANTYGIADNASREIRLPDDYKYDDAKPGQAVKPMTIFGAEAKVDSSASPRQAFANWLTSRDNPRFALSIANRMWKRVMGQALIDPVDEITDKSVPTHPELMKYLADQMIAVNFSLRDFQRMLYYTDTYQRAALTADLGPSEVYAYQGRLIRRLSGEQMWDCLVTLASNEPDKLTREIVVGPPDFAGKTAEEIVAYVQSRRGGMMMDSAAGAKGAIPAHLGPMGPAVVRAANLESPAPAGHFVRQFGQSDREQIDGATTNPSISQVLNLLNGEIDSLVLNPNSQIMKTLAATRNNADKVNIIFTAILSRPASAAEARMCLSIIARNDQTGTRDLIWALLNTREFMFVQ